MTEPSDDELDLIDSDASAMANQNPVGTQAAWRKAYLAAFASAVLAKWGNQAQAAEPVAWLYDWVGGDGVVRDWFSTDYDEAHSPTNRAHNIRPLYPAPQPVAREPLSDEQIEALPIWKRFVGLWPETRREIVRIIEAQHGIKGGQHGTE